MQPIAKTACAYIRTSSAANVGPDKDSAKRQTAAIRAFAKSQGLNIVRTFTDDGVSGTLEIQDRPGFTAMLDYMYRNCARTILIENPSRLARKVLVQELAFKKLQERDIDLVPVTDPAFFTAEDNDPDGMRELMRTIIGAFAAFERKGIVTRLQKARDRKSAELGYRIEGPKVPAEVIKAAKRLARVNPKTHQRRSLRGIAANLAALGHLSPSDRAYGPESIKRMIAR